MKEIKDQVKEFWNKAYGDNTPVAIDKKYLIPSNTFDKDIEEFSKNSSHILDYGCGITFNLYIAYETNKNLVEALGIDPSTNAVAFAEGSARLSNFDTVHYLVGDIDELKKLPDNKYDFVICSNVLDCIDETSRNETVTELYRVLKKDGYFLLKVNFYLDKKTASQYKLFPLDEHNYSQDGLFRISFYEDDYWVNLFTKLGLVLYRKDLFSRREGLPADRIFIFKK